MSLQYYQPRQQCPRNWQGRWHSWQRTGNKLVCIHCGKRCAAQSCDHDWQAWGADASFQRCRHCGETRKVGAA